MKQTTDEGTDMQSSGLELLEPKKAAGRGDAGFSRREQDSGESSSATGEPGIEVPEAPGPGESTIDARIQALLELRRSQSDAVENVLDVDEPGSFVHERDLDRVQYTELYTEKDSPLADVRGYMLRVLLYPVVLLSFVAIVFGITVKIPRRLDLPCVLQASSGQYVIGLFDEVRLQDYHVEIGEEVADGAPLVTVTSPKIVALLTAHRSARSELALHLEHEQQILRCSLERQALEARKCEIRLQLIAGRIETARHQYQGGLVTDQELGQLVAEEKQVRVEKEILEISATEAMLRHSRRTVELENRVQSVENEIARWYGPHKTREGSLVLEAPSAGVVTYLLRNDTDEGMAQAGEPLLRMNLSPVELSAACSVPPECIGMVREGSSLQIRLHSFPHHEWGVMTGRIRSLSQAPDRHGRYPFSAEILEDTGLEQHLLPGMTGEASITLASKSLTGQIADYLGRHEGRGPGSR